MNFKRFSVLIIIAVYSIYSPVFAQQTEKVKEPSLKEINLEDLWFNFSFYFQSGFDEFISMKDGLHYSVLEENGLNQYDYAKGELSKVIVSIDEFKRVGIKNTSSISNYTFSNDETKILLETNREAIYRHSYYCIASVYDLNTKKLTEINNGNKVKLPEISPDGKYVSFIRDNNLIIFDLLSKTETIITNDGEINKIINGSPDWVYEEEFSFSKAYFWSSDSKKIAWIRFDESGVKEWSMTIWGDLYPEEYKYKYPKAGEDNSKVSVHIYFLDSKMSSKVELGQEDDIYIPRIMWTKNPDELCILKLNRLQNKLDFLLYNSKTSQASVFLSDENKYYLDITDDYYFTCKQSTQKSSKQLCSNQNKYFFFLSEQEGFNQIYYYDFDLKQKIKMTNGEFDVVKIYGVDEMNGKVYYQAAAEKPINKEIYSITLKGKAERIGRNKGTADAYFSNGFKYCVIGWSDGNTPYITEIFNEKGRSIREINDGSNENSILKNYYFPKKEFFTITTSAGVELNAWMIKPHNFTEGRKYPVLMYCYGGPGSNTVNNEWDYLDMWHRMIASKGYIVVSVDNRGTAFRGNEFKKCTYKQLGNLEANDQIEAANYLSGLPYIDNERIGIWGWSFGGYLSLLSILKGSGVFKMAIAVAPVTNWRYYDNIYTERFMQKPQDNPEGYDENSPVNFVKNLKGKLLIIHGTSDDNVHVQNTMEIVKALNNANKQFDMHLYPNKNHGIYGGATRYHLFTKITNYIYNNL